jgi:MFS family permease
LGALVYAPSEGIKPDSGVAALYFAAGMGLFLGMMIARRAGAYLHLKGTTIGFIGWSLFIQGIFFGVSGLMPTLWASCVLLAISRLLLGAEFAVQETLLMRLVPDYLRGRVSTSDRAGEMLIWAFSTAAAERSLHWMNVRTLTLVAGLLSGLSGLMWLMLFASQRVRLPRRLVHRLE